MTAGTADLTPDDLHEFANDAEDTGLHAAAEICREAADALAAANTRIEELEADYQRVNDQREAAIHIYREDRYDKVELMWEALTDRGSDIPAALDSRQEGP